MTILFDEVMKDPRAFTAKMLELRIPPPLNLKYDRPDQDAIEAGVVSRFDLKALFQTCF